VVDVGIHTGLTRRPQCYLWANVEIYKYIYFTHLQFSKLYLIAKQFIADQLQISSALLRGNVKVITLNSTTNFHHHWSVKYSVFG